MIVVVDANVIVEDPNLRSEVWKHLTVAVGRRRVRVLVPEIALEEAVAKRRQKLKLIGRTLRENAGRAPAEVRELAIQAQSECQRIGEEYEQNLRDIWAEGGFEIMPTSTAAHVDVARRAIKRVRPFNAQGNGYRDTLHWLTLLDVARQAPYEQVTFVTSDRIFSTKSNTLFPSLIDEFQTVSKSTVTLLLKLGDLEVPGHYITEPRDAPEYENSLKARLLALLDTENALSKIHTVGVTLPWSDWDELHNVAGLDFTSITARRVDNQTTSELQFEATATFTIRGTYINDDLEAPQTSTRYADLEVRITGVATTLNTNDVATLREVDATHIGEDLILVDEIKHASSIGLNMVKRLELEQIFGTTAVKRVENKLARSVL
jgi:hypothetical protein